MNVVVQQRAWQKEHFCQIGDESGAIHLCAALIEQRDNFSDDSFHAADTILIIIVALKRNAVEAAFDKRQTRRLGSGVELGVIDGERRTIHAL